MRPLVALLVGAFVIASTAAPASAQIMKVEFKDPKKAKSFKQHCIEENDELILVGEPKSGIKLDEEKNQILYDGQKTNELWVADMDNPRACPYKLQKGEKVRSGGKSVVVINGPDIKGITVFIRDQSLFGLSKEYARRDDEIDELKKERDALKRGSIEWRAKQTALVQTMERMKSWLAETLYSRAAKKVAKEIDAEVKAAKDANAQRLVEAKASIKMVPAPEDLVKTAKEVYGDAAVFHCQESQHARMIYREEVGDDHVKSVMELVENVIEGFRVQFVDPYIKEDFKDYIPDGLFIEWYFGPDDIAQNEQFLKKYYGITFDPDPGRHEKQAKAGGHGSRRGKVYCDQWKVGEQHDLEGMVTHNLGHHLVNIHYNQDRANDVSDWLYEGVGNWLSLEYLGRNSVNCFSLDIAKYAKKAKDGNDESGLLMGTADIYHRLALEQGPALDALAIKKLVDFEDPDVAKSYSVFNFVAKTQGEKGQRWLRACCNAANVPGSFAAQWRKKSEELYETTGVDIFKKLNDEWAAFANEQIGGAPSK
jgi:hypothetical protein